MQLSTIEQQVINNMHGLPLDQQRAILDLSLFLINRTPNYPAEQPKQQDDVSFSQFLKRFLKEVEEEPLDIDTRLFDQDRPQESGRAIDL